MHRRIADEYSGGAAVTKFPTKDQTLNLINDKAVLSQEDRTMPQLLSV